MFHGNKILFEGVPWHSRDVLWCSSGVPRVFKCVQWVFQVLPRVVPGVSEGVPGLIQGGSKLVMCFTRFSMGPLQAFQDVQDTLELPWKRISGFRPLG